MSTYSVFNDIFKSDPAEFGPRLSALFRDLRVSDDFPCTAFTALAENYFGQPETKGIKDAVFTALELADEQNLNGYHNHHHNREVVAVTIALLLKHQMSNLQPRLSNDLIWLTIAASAIHDYKHDGTSNKVNGIVHPMRLEQHALSQAKSRLIDAGISEQNWAQLEAMILPTDITPTDKPSPSAQLKEIFSYHSGNTSKPDYIDSHLQSLLENDELALCAAILGDADLSISAGLDPIMANQNSICVEVESNGAILATPQSYKGFLDFVCKGFPASPAGQVLLLPGLTQIRISNNNDLALIKTGMNPAVA